MSSTSDGAPATRDELPIERHKRSILYLLEKQRVLLIACDTGSGKSTQIPLILFSPETYNQGHDDKKITDIGYRHKLIAIFLGLGARKYWRLLTRLSYHFLRAAISKEHAACAIDRSLIGGGSARSNFVTLCTKWQDELFILLIRNSQHLQTRCH